jgi:hypothetical protein
LPTAVTACAVISVPPMTFFAVLNRYFSMGGTGGSLANR